MRAIVYRTPGGPEVLQLTEDRPEPEPGPGEVLVRMRVSGVNPTDWKTRTSGPDDGVARVPNQDGSGDVEAVGAGVPESRVGEKVWLWEAAYQRADGTAQELVAIPSDQAVALPEGASYDLGAALAVPAITAHRALTLAVGGPARLAPGALAGRTVLVQGGAGAVGHAAIELAVWAGATVITTISNDEKADLARSAGAHHVVNYRTQDAEAEITGLAPDGVDIVVEVSLPANAALDAAVAANGAVIGFYADNGGAEATIPVRPSMVKNLVWHAILLYTVPKPAKIEAIVAITAAIRDGALRVGEDAGLPLVRFPLEQTADAHRAVQDGAVGKVLIDV